MVRDRYLRDFVYGNMNAEKRIMSGKYVLPVSINTNGDRYLYIGDPANEYKVVRNKEIALEAPFAYWINKAADHRADFTGKNLDGIIGRLDGMTYGHPIDRRIFKVAKIASVNFKVQGT